MTNDSSSIGELRIEISIDATPDKVWKALTEDIGDWWPEDFYSGGQPGDRQFHLEAHVGGRMFETWSDGGGTLWASVISIVPKKTLQLVGNQFPNWGGPLQWYGTWAFSENAGGTHIDFSEAAMGKVSEHSLTEKRQGWQFLCESLKAHVEGRPAPCWPEG